MRWFRDFALHLLLSFLFLITLYLLIESFDSFFLDVYVVIEWIYPTRSLLASLVNAQALSCIFYCRQPGGAHERVKSAGQPGPARHSRRQ